MKILVVYLLELKESEITVNRKITYKNNKQHMNYNIPTFLFFKFFKISILGEKWPL